MSPMNKEAVSLIIMAILAVLFLIAFIDPKDPYLEGLITKESIQ